uniref:Reverse transcriptase domain-containing protein n=1 Tax=Oryzias sinensis TaxID=183150 RepID=A0A8C7Y4N6_9TELE
QSYKIPIYMAFVDYEKAFDSILHKDLSKLLNDLNKEGRKDGIKMNKKKTKIMCNEI